MADKSDSGKQVEICPSCAGTGIGVMNYPAELITSVRCPTCGTFLSVTVQLTEQEGNSGPTSMNCPDCQGEIYVPTNSVGFAGCHYCSGSGWVKKKS
jgi:hypothetical protein